MLSFLGIRELDLHLPSLKTFHIADVNNACNSTIFEA